MGLTGISKKELNQAIAKESEYLKWLLGTKFEQAIPNEVKKQIKEVIESFKFNQQMMNDILSDIRNLLHTRLEAERIFYETIPILDFFEREKPITLEQLMKNTKLPKAQVRHLLRPWLNNEVIKEISRNTYQIDASNVFHKIADGFFKETESSIDALIQDRQKQKIEG